MVAFHNFAKEKELGKSCNINAKWIKHEVKKLSTWYWIKMNWQLVLI